VNLQFNFPSKERILKLSLASLGAILIGAVGSGVWQGLLGPALQVGTRALLNVMSFAFHSFKDGVYLQIAQDNSSLASVTTFELLTTICMAALGFLMGFGFADYRIKKKKLANLEIRLAALNKITSAQSVVDQPEVSTPDPKARIASLIKELVSLRRQADVFQFSVGLIIMAAVVFQVISLSKVSYINSAVVHYHQVLRIASPYLDAQERFQFESKFAQIRRRDDYVDIQQKLEKVSKDHGVEVPIFKPW
jgi:hypothetical protein